MRSGRAMPRSAAPARRAMIPTAARCATDRAADDQEACLGPADAPCPLAAGGTDPVQLVVGGKWEARLAHLVGHRDPDPATVPATVGLCRQFDSAVRELRPGPGIGASAPSGQ